MPFDSKMAAVMGSVVGGSGGSGGSGADWSQNDPTAPDYVKNRPFYSEETEVVVIAEQYFETTEALGGFGAPLTADANWGNDFSGTPCVVHCLGERYELQYIYTDYSMGYLGNGSLLIPDLENTGEPFAIYSSAGAWNIQFAENISGYISVAQIKTEVHKLDSKYLPNDVGGGGGGGALFFDITGMYTQTGDYEYTVTKNYDELYEAFLAGCPVYILCEREYLAVFCLEIVEGSCLTICTYCLPGNSGSMHSILNCTNGSYHG